ncbi:hypothetical protein KC19_2G161600 [Ceratodon purpureus]|uniref:Uncharacterized protein n=1 Tax=Ceratodon purpureus TaxID=3225 RepID=A0A8T0IWU1_CERPU|nr:hypothetical protein KC19_2G161600 [Ceratodon purpureus]
MEQSPSALQDARNLGDGELEASSSKTSSTLKLVYQKVMYSFRKPRRKQSGITCLPPIEEELQASVNAIEEERRARVNEISVHHLVESTVDDVPTSAEYSSARIHRMMRTRSSFSADLEFEIESSKVHWSETVPLSDESELVSQDLQAFFEHGIFAGEKCPELMEYVKNVCNASLDHKTRDKQLMCMLQHRWAPKFSFNICESKWEVGSLIADGAQAEIFEANPKRECPECHGQGRICRWLGVFPRNKYIVKVFRKGYRLRDLQRLWPKQVVTGYSTLYTCPIRGWYLLPNGRFAFMMPRYWGDLCKLLDQRMQQRLDCTHPPCSDWEVTRSMLYIAKGM